MPLDILTFGEALAEVMRTGIDQPLDQPFPFVGPYPSGAPFIFTVQAARLGARASCIGCVGDDAFGRNLLNQLKQDGVDTRGVHILPDFTTGVAFIAYRGDGSRDFVFHLKQAAAGQLSPDLLSPDLFDGLKLLHLSGSSLSINEGAFALGEKALAMAKAAGARISFDLNIRPQLIKLEQARQTFAPFLDAADLIFATPEEAQLFTGAATVAEAAAALKGTGSIRPIVIHQGKEGCTVHVGDATAHVPAYTVAEIDPTGAGDCFDAGFLVRWLSHGSNSLEALVDAARFANACGALAVTQQGPMMGAATLDAVQAFMAEGR